MNVIIPAGLKSTVNLDPVLGIGPKYRLDNVSSIKPGVIKITLVSRRIIALNLVPSHSQKIPTIQQG